MNTKFSMPLREVTPSIHELYMSRFIKPMLPARLVLVVMCVCECVCVWACRRISADQRASDHHLHQLQLIIPPYIFSPLSHLLCQIVVCSPGCLVIPSSFLFVFSWVCALRIRHGTSGALRIRHGTSGLLFTALI